MTGEPGWTIRYQGLDPEAVGQREALCTLGNGYFATRGAAPEACADGVHYPGTYVAGCYNRLRSRVAGGVSDDESLVNAPNWLPVTFTIDDGPWLAPAAGGDLAGLSDHTLELDLRHGVLTRRTRLRDSQDRTIAVTQRRFVHMGHPHLAGLETRIVVDEWAGQLRIRSGIDGAVRNTNVRRYRLLASAHLRLDRATEAGGHGRAAGTVLLTATTSQSHVTIAEAARTQVTVNGAPGVTGRRLVRESPSGRVPFIGHEFTVDVGPGDVVVVEKIAALYTSRDHAISEPGDAAVAAVQRAAGFDDLLASHAAAWERQWDRFPFSLVDDSARVAAADADYGAGWEAQRILRLHLFHVLQTVSPHTADLDVGVPARGLHGEAYRGHVFWDELFVLPVLHLRLPGVARALLRYRYRRLDAAREAARAAGHVGAMYPWQSGSDGREESARVHLNPVSGRWLPDITYRQRHVGLAIAYNIWQYYEATGDLEYLVEEGAEMLLEIARFFASLTTYDPRRDRYVIRGVVGPDEFHTGYPDPDRASGIDNNAYTNVMTAWLMRHTREVLDRLPAWRRAELCEPLGLPSALLHRFTDISQRMFVPFHLDGENPATAVPVISQFEGYADLAELDWAAYRQRYGDIRRLDRILEAEGDSINRYQASKQADVLMLFYLLSAKELTTVFTGLGYKFPAATIPRTIDYYLARTSHGSTLSAVVHAWVLALVHRPDAMTYFAEALRSDTADVQGGTTAEGIHLAAMAGSATVLVRCFAGIDTRGDVLRLNPMWPPQLGTLTLGIRYRGHLLYIRVTGNTAEVVSRDAACPPIRVACHDQILTLACGGSITFTLPPTRPTHPVPTQRTP